MLHVISITWHKLLRTNAVKILNIYYSWICNESLLLNIFVSFTGWWWSGGADHSCSHKIVIGGA